MDSLLMDLDAHVVETILRKSGKSKIVKIAEHLCIAHVQYRKDTAKSALKVNGNGVESLIHIGDLNVFAGSVESNWKINAHYVVNPFK